MKDEIFFLHCSAVAKSTQNSSAEPSLLVEDVCVYPYEHGSDLFDGKGCVIVCLLALPSLQSSALSRWEQAP